LSYRNQYCSCGIRLIKLIKMTKRLMCTVRIERHPARIETELNEIKICWPQYNSTFGCALADNVPTDIPWQYPWLVSPRTLRLTFAKFARSFSSAPSCSPFCFEMISCA